MKVYYHQKTQLHCNATCCTLLKCSAQVFLRSHTLEIILPTPEIQGEVQDESEINNQIRKLKEAKKQ